MRIWRGADLTCVRACLYKLGFLLTTLSLHYHHPETARTQTHTHTDTCTQTHMHPHTHTPPLSLSSTVEHTVSPSHGLLLEAPIIKAKHLDEGLDKVNSIQQVMFPSLTLTSLLDVFLLSTSIN